MKKTKEQQYNSIARWWLIERLIKKEECSPKFSRYCIVNKENLKTRKDKFKIIIGPFKSKRLGIAWANLYLTGKMPSECVDNINLFTYDIKGVDNGTD